MLDGGTWAAKTKAEEKMKETRKKYFVSRNKFVRTEAPSLKGAKLNAIADTVAKLGLGEQESRHAVSIMAKDRAPVMINKTNEKDGRRPGHHSEAPHEMRVQDVDDDGKIAGAVNDLQKEDCDKVFAASCQLPVTNYQRRSRQGLEEQHGKMVEMYMGVWGILERVKNVFRDKGDIGDVTNLHGDLWQVPRTIGRHRRG